MKPSLHGVEVEDAVAHDHDLPVEARPSREELSEGPELGEVAKQRARVPRPEAKLAGAVLEQAAEAVPLRLVLPRLAVGELADELRLHRREGDRRIEIGGALDRLSGSAGARHGHTVQPSSLRIPCDGW